MPRVTVSWENLSSLPRVSRGTPIPAESFWNTKDLVALETPDVGTGFELTAIRLGSRGLGGRAGACGARIGPPLNLPAPVPEPPVGNEEEATLLTPYQPPPGIQPQPAFPQLVQVPV